MHSSAKKIKSAHEPWLLRTLNIVRSYPEHRTWSLGTDRIWSQSNETDVKVLGKLIYCKKGVTNKFSTTPPPPPVPW